jgi:DNA polymerase III epsilon subunit-like protein
MSMEYRVVLSYLNKSIEAATKYLGSPREMFDRLSDKTFIFFDTETTGLDHHKNQVTEIGAQVVTAPEFRVEDKFHNKIHLSEETKKKMEEEEDSKFNIKNVLKMNDYYGNPEVVRGSEKDVLNDFKDFCDKYPGAILVAQNAEFDIKMVKRVADVTNREVIDTVRLAGFYVVPILIAMEQEGDLHKKINARGIIKDMTSDKGKITKTLGKILPALGGTLKNWHTALDDTKSAIALYRAIIKFVNENIEFSGTDTYLKEQSKYRSDLESYKPRGKRLKKWEKKNKEKDK